MVLYPYKISSFQIPSVLPSIALHASPYILVDFCVAVPCFAMFCSSSASLRTIKRSDSVMSYTSELVGGAGNLSTYATFGFRSARVEIVSVGINWKLHVTL